MSGTGWMSQAACRDADQRLFEPQQQTVAVREEQLRTALRYCAVCPVLDACADFADTPWPGERHMSGLIAGAYRGSRQGWRLLIPQGRAPARVAS